ncbi:MAG: hypothetical protein PHQ43_10770 [Dehalococcoidales bacterium]|nr:hypothetical protein [Dehalococcoidales bacterium]
MKQEEVIERLANALKRVPAKRLKIIDLANQFTRDGQLDYDGLNEAQPEVNLAVAEARTYASHTVEAVRVLSSLKGVSPDVGPGNS